MNIYLRKSIQCIFCFSLAIQYSFSYLGKPIPPQRFFNKSMESSIQVLELPSYYQCSFNSQCMPGLSCNKDYPDNIRYPLPIQLGYCSCYRGQKGINFLSENESTLTPSSINNLNSVFMYNRYGCSTQPTYSYDKNFMPIIMDNRQNSRTYNLTTLYFNTGASWKHILMTKPYPDMSLKFLNNRSVNITNVKKNSSTFIYNRANNYKRYVLDRLPGFDFYINLGKNDTGSSKGNYSKYNVLFDYSCLDPSYEELNKKDVIVCDQNMEQMKKESERICVFTAFNNEIKALKSSSVSHPFSYNLKCAPLVVFNDNKKFYYKTKISDRLKYGSDRLCTERSGATNDVSEKLLYCKEKLKYIEFSCETDSSITQGVKKILRKNCDVYKDLYLSRLKYRLEAADIINNDYNNLRRSVKTNKSPAHSLLNKDYINVINVEDYDNFNVSGTDNVFYPNSDNITTLSIFNSKINQELFIYYNYCIYNTDPNKSFTLKKM